MTAQAVAGQVARLRVGETIRLDRCASPQFVRPITVRVIRVLDRPTYDGWAWVEGYELDGPDCEAVRKRQLFINLGGSREGNRRSA